jgi:hypothetical protein
MSSSSLSDNANQAPESRFCIAISFAISATLFAVSLLFLITASITAWIARVLEW